MNNLNMDLGVGEFQSDIDLNPNNQQSKVLDIDISDIDAYKNNPRQSINPNYDAIKASISAVGLLQLFTVSLNPKTSRYTPTQGGNTRLKIIKELYKETGEVKFQTIECIVIAWDDSVNENSIQIKHLIENEKRGDLNLADKARCIVEIETQYKNDNKNQDTTTKSFLNYLLKEGFILSENYLGVYRFVNNKLTPLEFHLNKEFSIANVRKIRSIYNNLNKRVFKDSTTEAGIDIDELFAKSMQNYKSKKDFKFDELLDAMLWSLLDANKGFLQNTYNYGSLKKELLHVVKKEKVIKPDKTNNDDVSKQNIEPVTLSEPIEPLKILPAPQLSKEHTTQPATPLEPVPIAPINDIGTGSNQIDDDVSPYNDTPSEIKPSYPEIPTKNTNTKQNDTSANKHISVNKANSDNYQLATSIAASVGLEYIIADIGTLGHGFLIINIPKPNQQLDEAYNQWMMFWLLLSFSGAVDISNLIIDSESLMDGIDVGSDKLLEIYNNQNNNNEVILNEIYNIQPVDDKSPEPYPNFISTFKQQLEPQVWQKLSTLEFEVYKKNREQTQTNTSIWDVQQ